MDNKFRRNYCVVTSIITKEKRLKKSNESEAKVEKLLFKPFKISEKAKQKIREIRNNLIPNQSELLNKIDSLLKIVLKTPQSTLVESSRIQTRHSSKHINVLEEDSDKITDQDSETTSEKEINPIITKNSWKNLSKLYYPRATAPDLLLEEKNKGNFKSFSANNIYEWNRDLQDS